MDRTRGTECPLAIYYWFIQVLIVFGLIAGVLWLSTRPRIPEFTITGVYIPPIGSQNMSKVQQTNATALVFVLKITNPNRRMTICYVDMIMKLHNGGGLLMGSKSMEAFCQGRKKTVTAEVVIDVGQDLRRGNAGGGERLRVTVETRVKYHVFMWTKIHRIGFEGFARIGTRGINVTENIYLHKTH